MYSRGIILKVTDDLSGANARRRNHWNSNATLLPASLVVEESRDIIAV